jgi:AraC family transcriptional regulator
MALLIPRFPSHVLMRTLPIVGDDVGRVLNDPRRGLHDRDEMAASETHGIAQWTSNQLVIDSAGLGWHDAYTSLAMESSWNATLSPLPHYGLAYCLRRSAHIRRRVEGSPTEDADLLPRRFGMIPADRASTWQLDGDPEVQLVYLRRETVDELAVDEFETDPGDVHVEPRLGFTDPMLEQLVTALLGAVRDRERVPESALWSDHVIRLIGLELLCRYSNVARMPSKASEVTPTMLRAAREYIEANLTADLSLSRIAEAVGARPHRLAKDFRAGTGEPLHQYVIGRRLDRAARLLRATDDPIAGIALECGFADQSHLTTAFRRRIGVTPAAYRSA